MTSYLNFRFRRLWPLFEAEPIVLVESGRVIESNLRRERISIEEVAAEARLQQIESLERAKWAVLERNDSISFVPQRS